MKNIFNYKYVVVSAALSSMAVATSCREDFDYEEAYRTNPAFVYKESFEKAYGTIDPNQSWDFTTQNIGTRAVTPAPTITVSTDYYTVEDGTLDWLQKTLIEQDQDNKDNSGGVTFVLQAPGNSFKITPIYMGATWWDFDLYMQVGDATPVKLMGKGDYMEYYTRNEWKSVKNYYSNGILGFGSGWNTYDQTSQNMHTMNASQVRAKSLTIDNIEKGTTISFYLKIGSTTQNRYAATGDIYQSTTNMLSLTNLPKPTGISADHEVMIIGCEASNLRDKDFNDLVLLVEGEPYIPKTIEVVPGTPFKKTISSITKRYMVEDLGATTQSDIDFNDVVIDITEESWKMVYIESDNVGLSTEKDVTPAETGTDRIAEIKALGGTKDIAIYLSNNTVDNAAPANDDVCIFRKSTSSGDIPVVINGDYSKDANNERVFDIRGGLTTNIMYNTSWAKTEGGDGYYLPSDFIATINLNAITVDSRQWMPSKNNIYVKVSNAPSGWSSSTEVTDATVITFPRNGEVPAMIAVDPYKQWNYEKQCVFDPKDPTDGHFLYLIDGGVE